MEYSYKFRIYPNAEQRALIQKTFGCSRFVYNHFLAQRISEYKATGKAPTRFQQDKMLTALKREILWLKEVDSIPLQAELQNLDSAYQGFFRRVKKGEKPVSRASRVSGTGESPTRPNSTLPMGSRLFMLMISTSAYPNLAL